MLRFTIVNVQLNWLRLERDHCDRSIFSRSMASLSSEEAFGSGFDQEQSEWCGSYSLSADISESESCSSSFSCRQFETECGASCSMTSSPHPVANNFLFLAPMMLPVIGGKDVVGSLGWDKKKPEKPKTDLFGTFYFSFLLFIFTIYYLFGTFYFSFLLFIFSIFYLFLFSKLLLTIL